MVTKDKQPEEAQKLDEAPQPGGVYVKDGQVVDAEGKVLEGWTVDDNGNTVKVNAPPSNAPAPSENK